MTDNRLRRESLPSLDGIALVTYIVVGSRPFQATMGVLALLGVIGLFTETHWPDDSAMRERIGWLELLLGIVFAIEYALRLFMARVDPRFAGSRNGFTAALRWACTPGAFLDLLAFLPMLLSGTNLLAARLVRLLRLVRILKLGRLAAAVAQLGEVVGSKRHELGASVLVTAIALVSSSAIIYELEHDTQPEAFPTMAEALWWGVVTMSSTGYGDVVPKTTLGRIFGGMIMFLGIGVFALPAGIIASGLVEHTRAVRERERGPGCCATCGRGG